MMIMRILLALVFIFCLASISFSADMEPRLNILEETLKKQQKMMEEQQELIRNLKEELSALRRQTPDKVEEKQPLEASKSNIHTPSGKEDTLKISGGFGDFFKDLKNPALTFVLNSFFYSSSVDERKLRNRGITGFSIAGIDHKKGFNIDEGSIALFAPVDKYFDLFGVLSFTEDKASLEEGYFYTKALPSDLRLKGGKFRSSFTGHNELHPHDWDFADNALIYRGFMGREGINEKGAQLIWRPALPLNPLLGLEVLQGENEILFNKDSNGGPHAFTAYAKASYDFNKNSKLYFGPYIVNGKTQTDSISDNTVFRGNSTLYGLETFYKWKSSEERSLTIQAEYMRRDQTGSLENVTSGSTERLSRSQDGFYLQSLYQIGKWRAGARYDRLNILTGTYRLAGTPQYFGNPWRLTGALEFNPSEYSRFRLQYNYDRSGGGAVAQGGASKTNHEVYLQMIFAIGAHAEPQGQRD
jgi:hypothetical protein